MLDSCKTEANVVADHCKIGQTFVNIGRQYLNSLFGAVVDIFGNLGVVSHNGGQKRCIVSKRIMRFQVCSPI